MLYPRLGLQERGFAAFGASGRALAICLAFSTQALAASFNEIAVERSSALVYLEVKNALGEVVNQASGFVVSHEGHVITVAHLKVGANQRLVGTIGERSFSLALRDADERSDVALWAIERNRVCRPAAVLSTSKVGLLDDVLALGFPRGDFTPAILRINRLENDRGFFQTDGYLEPGNSGGPVFNASGHIVGMVRGGRSYGSEANEVIPIALARHILAKWNIKIGVDAEIPYRDECFTVCTRIEHGVLDYRFSETWEKSSGWLGPDNDKQDVCNGLASAVSVEKLPHRATVTDIRPEERTDILGRKEFRFHCKGTAYFDPIYVRKRSPACELQN